MAKLNFWRQGDSGATGSAPEAARPRSAPTGSQRDEAVLLVRAYEESGLGWFWSTDHEGRVTYLSPSVAEQLHTGTDSQLGRAFSDLFEKVDDASGPLRTIAFVLTKHTKFEKLTLRSGNDDDVRWWSVSGAPQFDSSGNFTGFRGHGLDITEQRQSSESASQLALCDSLTGLPNRLRMLQLLEANLSGIDHHKRPCAVMLMDLDRFKQVNDTLGHPAGDALLRQVSERLTRIVGEGERVFRLGGDEFQIILRDCDDRGELGRIANDIIALISQPYSVEGSRCIIGASIGIAVAPFDGTTAEDLIRNSDLALYAAKDSGRGKFRFFASEFLQVAEDKRLLESDLRDALAKGELNLVYQPIVCAEDNRPTGVETLIRWTHPERGPVSPGLFIPIAEEANLIEPLGEWILRKACEDATAWPGKLRVAVNVSPLQFANENFPAIVISALANSGLPPERLELEITEGVFLAESAETDDMFAKLKAIGVRLALDDFGTGYSSLSYLKTAPFDKIKIDQSFVRQATLPGSRNVAIIAAIVALAEALDMETTAEGIESLDQLALVRALRVSHIQGYVYSPGVNNETLTGKLEAGDWVIEPSGPAKQRSPRHSIYRKVGAIYGNHYKAVLIRNLSQSGALIEGLPDLAIDTGLLIDFGGGEIAYAQIRRAGRGQHGIEFEEALVSDGNGGFCARHRVSPYLLASAGLPAQQGYPDAETILDPARGGTVEYIAARLGIGLPEEGNGGQSAGALDKEFAGLSGLSLLSGRSNSERGLPREQVDKLIEAAKQSHNPQLKHIVSLLLLTGARQRELLEARWDDFDLEKAVWRITDSVSGKLRVIQLSNEVIEIVRELPRWKDCPHLIVNPKTQKPYLSFSSSWETARKRAGLPYIEIDELRHSGGGLRKAR